MPGEDVWEFSIGVPRVLGMNPAISFVVDTLNTDRAWGSIMFEGESADVMLDTSEATGVLYDEDTEDVVMSMLLVGIKEPTAYVKIFLRPDVPQVRVQ
jgi:hypothetical protein